MEQVGVCDKANMLGDGAFGVVFPSADRTRAFKVFRKTDDKPEDYYRMVFESELRACRIANADMTCRLHVPKLYGIGIVEKVLDPERGDVSDHFLLDCCIVT